MDGYIVQVVIRQDRGMTLRADCVQRLDALTVVDYWALRPIKAH